MLQKFNTLITGIIIGIIIPAAFYLIFVLPKMRHFAFIGEYYGKMVLKFLPIFLSRCIFPNALVFFLLLWVDFTEAANGVLYSTAVMTALLLIISFVL